MVILNTIFFVVFLQVFFEVRTQIVSTSENVKKSGKLPALTGGLCWSLPSKRGRCTDLLLTDVTREECCNASTNTKFATAYSAGDLKPGRIFFYRAFKENANCEKMRCLAEKRCIMKEGYPKCVCSSKCPRRKRKLGPLCGSDGRTYRNVCRLLKRRCRKDPLLSVAYLGICQGGCEKIRCIHNKTCVMDQNSQPHCVRCRTRCPSAKRMPSQTICGSNNITYPTHCHLRRAACLNDKAIKLSYFGPCVYNATKISA